MHRTWITIRYVDWEKGHIDFAKTAPWYRREARERLCHLKSTSFPPSLLLLSPHHDYKNEHALSSIIEHPRYSSVHVCICTCRYLRTLLRHPLPPKLNQLTCSSRPDVLEAGAPYRSTTVCAEATPTWSIPQPKLSQFTPVSTCDIMSRENLGALNRHVRR